MSIKQPLTSASLPQQSLVRVAVGSLLCLYLAICVASFLPHVRLWSLNHLAFYPLPVRLLALAVMGLVFLPSIAYRTYSMFVQVSESFLPRNRHATFLITLFSLISTGVLYLFRSSTDLLGDGQLIARSFEAAHQGNTSVAMRSFSAIVTEEPIARGAMLMYFVAAKIATSIFKVSPVDGIRAFNCLLGGLFVFVCLKVIQSELISPVLRVWFLFLALFSGAMQLFFGYMEYYAVVVFIFFLYVISCYRVFHGLGSIWIAVILFVVAVYSHSEAILLAPSLAFLILWRILKTQPIVHVRILTTLLIALTVIGVCVLGFTKLGEYYVSLHGTEQSSGLFSFTHWVDIANELLILLPTLPFFIASGLMILRSPLIAAGPQAQESHKPRQEGSRGGQWFSSTAERHFAVVATVPSMIYMVIFKAELGMVRDWDLFAIAGVGLALCALLIMSRLDVDSIPRFSRALYTSPALTISVVLAVAWFGVNASSLRATERFRSTLTYDSTLAEYAYESLGAYYYKSGRLASAIEMMENATERSPNPRLMNVLAKYYLQAGDEKRATNVLNRILEKDPGNELALFYLVGLHERTRQYRDIVRLTREGIKHNPKSLFLQTSLGAGLLALGEVEEGIEILHHAKTLNPSQHVLQQINSLLRQYGASTEEDE